MHCIILPVHLVFLLFCFTFTFSFYLVLVFFSLFCSVPYLILFLTSTSLCHYIFMIIHIPLPRALLNLQSMSLQQTDLLQTMVHCWSMDSHILLYIIYHSEFHELHSILRASYESHSRIHTHFSPRSLRSQVHLMKGHKSTILSSIDSTLVLQFCSTISYNGYRISDS